jgi:predicted aspartyl protease
LPASAACSLKTQPIPVTMIGGIPMVSNGLPMVDVKVNGKSAHFLLDSGSAVNEINAKFAAAQKLASTKTSDKGPAVATVAKFEFAGATLANVPFVASDGLGAVDGVIGQTVLRQGDVEYDLLGGKVVLAKADDCKTANLAYWVKEGQTYSEMPLEPLDKDAPFTRSEIIINGVKLRAMFVSGTPYTMVTEKAAAKAGLKTSDPKVTLLSGGDGKSPKIWLGTFPSVQIGGDEIKNTPLEIIQTNDDFYDVVVGGDYFMTHHIYVANSQGKIYATFSGFPGAPVFMHKPNGSAATDASLGATRALGGVGVD